MPTMVFKAEHNTYIIGMLRRKWRKDGRFTVRVTHTGTISIIRMPLHKDMKTEAQMKCRMRFTKAQELMLEALADKKLRRFFQKKRLKQGYKTLRGCMRAYYIDQLIYQEQKEAREALGEMMRIHLSDVERNAESTSDIAQLTTPSKVFTETAITETDNKPTDDNAITATPTSECDIGDG